MNWLRDTWADMSANKRHLLMGFAAGFVLGAWLL